MHRPPARPVAASVDPVYGRLGELVDAMTDDVRVVTDIQLPQRPNDLLVLQVATYGCAGLERFAGALLHIESAVGLDEEGVLMEVALDVDRPPAESLRDQEWVPFTWVIEEPERRGPPTRRLLRDVAAAVRHHKEGLSPGDTRAPSATREPRLHTSDPRPVDHGRIEPEVRSVVAALANRDIRVLSTAWRKDRKGVLLGVAVHGSAGARQLMGGLQRAFVATRVFRKALWFDCHLLWAKGDGWRCDFERFPDWGMFNVRIPSPPALAN